MERVGREVWGESGAPDPHDRRSVYVGPSGLEGGGEGLYARRPALPGALLAYFGGRKTVEDDFLFANMTAEEEEDAASYYFNLAAFSPPWWGVPDGQVGDKQTNKQTTIKEYF